MQKYKSHLLGVVLACCGTAASAGVCDAPFMHDGGYLSLNGNGLISVQAQMNLSQVRIVNSNECEAFVNGNAAFGLAGLPGGKSKLHYWMSVKDGFARFERDIGGGGREIVKGGFDLNLLGLFNYDQAINAKGQQLPEQRFSVQFDKRSEKPVAVHTTAKTVGDEKEMPTALGPQSCFPIQYHRTVAATQVSISGLVMPIPEMQSEVTDWYCPSVQMVMRQDSVQNGVPSYIEVQEVR
ncbi:hypothetical protein L1889_10995 [Paenalcaligenes niemegkensis]|uniref:hypothetical protein n=1 Tax=Paenalcaligenes niemegkensis TaxID=2895469 RepID=UPI001EE925DA|nr:hypothetical protein [Paenalcaligenes niemegkensis]MCQ9617158.1 hypothetical protein [Paenalcaligenes niemegkensis]